MRPTLALALALLAPAAVSAQAATATEPTETIVDGVHVPPGVGPIAWAESHGAECHRSHGRRMCEGPRRVPRSDETALARAEALGVTSGLARRTATHPPPDAWVAAVGSEPAPDLLWPVQGGRVWRGFGIVRGIARGRHGHLRRTRQRHAHEGVDIGAAAGTPIVAANDGLVVYSDNGMTGYGNAVLIVHADASVTLYGHCSATFVVAGQRVARGEIIAAVGDTGLAHGAHLHFELHVAGAAVDPLPRIVGRPEASSPAPSEPAETGPTPSDTVAAVPEELDEP
jgi:murein DD-endopeptidase MepM/ murein hydrolase activator NlpD